MFHKEKVGKNMFQKEKFSEILNKIYKSYNNQRDFAKATGVNRGYLSRYINQKLDSPPSPKILQGIADSSKCVVSYIELMYICGYIEDEEVSIMYNQERFLKILRNIQGNKSLNDFAKDIDVDASVLSRISTYNRTSPLSPEMLRKIANNSRGVTTYVELLEICGYLNDDDLCEFKGKNNFNNEILIETKVESNIDEVTDKAKELVATLERANELINSLSKK